jgi:hypothetical protein
MTPQRNEPEAITTALSTLAARVAVLERWMRRSQRLQAAWTVVALIAIVVCAMLLTMR